MNDLLREIVDGRDLIDISERNLTRALDEATREIAARRGACRWSPPSRPARWSMSPSSPRRRCGSLRRISEIYGGRPGFLGFLRLARSVGAHLAITGGMAVGDSLVQQVLGHGLCRRGCRRGSAKACSTAC